MSDELLLRLSHWSASGGWLAPLEALVAAFVFGQAIAWTYEFTYRGLSYSRGFGQTIVLIGIGSAILVQAMSFSLIAGVGVLGVLSMIRFRVNLKAPRDLVFILGSATVGVASGVRALDVASLGALIFCAVALYLHLGTFGSKVRYDGVLRFRLPSTTSDVTRRLEAMLGRYCRRRDLLSLSEVAQGAFVEHAYQIKFWRDARREELLDELRRELGAGDARLLLQEATLEY